MKKAFKIIGKVVLGLLILFEYKHLKSSIGEVVPQPDMNTIVCSPSPSV